MSYISIFEEDYADEFNVCGFMVVKDEFYEKIKPILEKYEHENISFHFGTNEELEFKLKKIKFKHIDDEKAKIIFEIFRDNIRSEPPSYFGWGQYPYIIDDISEFYYNDTGEYLLLDI